jgi:hypothetical protein
VAFGTVIYKNGTLATAVPGSGIGWLDNNRFLAYDLDAHGNPTGLTVYDSSGATLTHGPLITLAAGQSGAIQIVGPDTFYDSLQNAIFTESPPWSSTWTTVSPSNGVGAVAGSRVVFWSGHQVLSQPYQ